MMIHRPSDIQIIRKNNRLMTHFFENFLGISIASIFLYWPLAFIDRVFGPYLHLTHL